MFSLFPRIILRALLDFDGWCSYISSLIFHRHYEIKGKCLQCGNCCQNIAIYLSDGFWMYPQLKKLVIRWYEWLYHFNFKQEEPQHKVLIFSCQYLQNQTCRIYHWRPYICRKYPLPRYFEKPSFLDSCGFKTELKKFKQKLK